MFAVWVGLGCSGENEPAEPAPVEAVAPEAAPVPEVAPAAAPETAPEGGAPDDTGVLVSATGALEVESTSAPLDDALAALVAARLPYRTGLEREPEPDRHRAIVRVATLAGDSGRVTLVVVALDGWAAKFAATRAAGGDDAVRALLARHERAMEGCETEWACDDLSESILGDPSQVNVHVLRFSQPAGAATPTFDRASETHTSGLQRIRIRHLQDLDDDGRRELALRLDTMDGGADWMDTRHRQWFLDADSLVMQAQVVRAEDSGGHQMPDTEIQRRVQPRDVDGDGHRDLVVHTSGGASDDPNTYEIDPVDASGDATWRYDPATDVWLSPAPPAASD